MRRLLTPGNSVAAAVIVAAAAMVVVSNLRNISRERAAYTRPALAGTRGTSTAKGELDRRIADLRQGLSQTPQDVGLAIILADALVRQARTTGNSGLTIEAERGLTRALDGDVANYDANRVLATVYLSQHRFREAIAIAERSRNERPGDPINYGVIGDGHLELGEYDEAFEAFDRMMALRPSAAAYARVSYARELQGNLPGAIEAMRLAAEATAANDPESIAWHRSQTGDLYLHLGKLHEAEGEYMAASHAYPGHPFAVIGYANLLAERGDRSGALALLQDVQRTAPTPDVAARIGDLLAQLGRAGEAERQWALAEAGWRADAPEPKNLARFLADHDRKIDEAVAIAEQAAADRRDIFTDDALAWAYFKSGRLDDARVAIKRALRTGSRDRDIRAHAAAIERAGND